MRIIILSTAVVLFLLALLAAGCGKQEVPQEWSSLEQKARDQASLALYTFKYDDYFLEIAAGFAEKTGIQVTVVKGSAEGTYQKMVAEKEGRGTVDLWLLSGPQVQPAVEGGLLYGPVLGVLPNAESIDPFDAQYAEGFAHGGYVVPAGRQGTNTRVKLVPYAVIGHNGHAHRHVSRTRAGTEINIVTCA